MLSFLTYLFFHTYKMLGWILKGHPLKMSVNVWELFEWDFFESQVLLLMLNQHSQTEGINTANLLQTIEQKSNSRYLRNTS